MMSTTAVTSKGRRVISNVCRFPFLANEIFNCEINAVLDKFFDAPEHPVKKPAPKEEVKQEDEVMQSPEKV
jgi:hypothetical protein